MLRLASCLLTLAVYRCAGRKGMLVRKAAKLFVHAKDIIAKTSLASSIGQEYSALLRAHFLPTSQYCNVVSSIPFQGSAMCPWPQLYSQHWLKAPQVSLVGAGMLLQ